jgi:DNA repair exonuclease SbcCD nuclease subunit
MSTRFIHTADWQLGKPFAGVEDDQKRALLRHERFTALERIAARAREHQAEFILVAGDLFDSPRATEAVVSAACSALGALALPVFAIPGNHDPGGAGSLWEQDFFRREQQQLAPNLTVLLEAKPVELASAVLLPCPLLRRREAGDPTAWLRSPELLAAWHTDKPRIVLAHGSVQDFGAWPDEEESDAPGANRIDLSRLAEDQFDYIALGDWHGAKQVSTKAWYSGTPELDRFSKGADHRPGHVLAVQAARGQPPLVQCQPTSVLGWHELEFSFAGEASLSALEERMTALVGTRANRDLLRLRLSGSLGLETANGLEQHLASWKARLLRLQLEAQTPLAPSRDELDQLTQRAEDPLISRVAAQLAAAAAGAGEDAAVARVALRELYAAVQRP